MEELDRWLGDQLKSPLASLVWVVVILFTRLVIPYLAKHPKAKIRRPRKSDPKGGSASPPAATSS